jgi:aspartate aminotransferase
MLPFTKLNRCTKKSFLLGKVSPKQTKAFMHEWNHIEMGPPDPILGITVAFRKDPNPLKMNLGVGAYRDDNGNPFVLECVKKARHLLESQDVNHEYAPIQGPPEFCTLSAKLLFGDNHVAITEKRVASAQALSGTGALRLAGEFLRKFTKNKEIHLPNPTWANHIPIFQNSGFATATYSYYDGKGGLDFEGMKKDIQNAAEGSIFLLHACAHNPTGVDPNETQWKELAQICKQKKHIILFDCAYQGFASGNPAQDAFSLREFTNQGINVVVTQSFAKSLGLYGERVGALHIVCDDAVEAEKVMSQLLIVIRPSYSSPPLFGARIVSLVLSTPELKTLWDKEVKMMADRIITMRSQLVAELKAAGSKKDWSHVTNQIGMFCYSGLTPPQVEKLTTNWHIYMTKNGRISMAGLFSNRVKYLAQAIHDVTKDDAANKE